MYAGDIESEQMGTSDDKSQQKKPMQYGTSALFVTTAVLAVLLAVAHYLGPSQLGKVALAVLDAVALFYIVGSIGIWISGYSRHDRW